MSEQFTLVDHPLVQHKLSLLRRKDTETQKFRHLVREISFILGCEATRELPLETAQIETPLEAISAPVLAGKKLCFVSILRAGNGLLDGLLELAPSARVGHVGLYRDPKTLKPVEYYCKLPGALEDRFVFLVDPMLATGGSAIAAADLLKDKGAKRVSFLCLLAAPEGVKAFHEEHPDIPIFTAGLDRELNDHGYILPGLGDAGDRIFGTK